MTSRSFRFRQVRFCSQSTMTTCNLLFWHPWQLWSIYLVISNAVVQQLYFTRQKPWILQISLPLKIVDPQKVPSFLGYIFNFKDLRAYSAFLLKYFCFLLYLIGVNLLQLMQNNGRATEHRIIGETHIKTLSPI